MHDRGFLAAGLEAFSAQQPGNPTRFGEAVCLLRSSVADFYPLHAHDFFELELVVQGDGFHYLNGQVLPLRPGAIFLLTPADVHRLKAASPLALLSLKVARAKAPEALGRLLDACQSARCAWLDWEECGEFFDLFAQVESALCSEAFYGEARLYALVTLMLARLFDLSPQAVAPSADATYRQLQRAVAYMQANCTRPLTLGRAAREAALSPCYFSDCFKKYVGCGFSEYLARCRVERARLFLSTTDKSVTEIAYASGFGSLSNFARAFRRYAGATASAYRRQACRPLS